MIETADGGAPRTPGRRAYRLALAWVISAAAALSANTLANGFVYDDRFQVLENPWLRDVANVPRAFVTNVWAFEGSVSNYYRPLMHVAYILTHQVFGLRAWGFHLVNVVLHAAAAGLVFVFARRVLAAAGLGARAVLTGALAAGLLFAAHPIHTEVVAWVACVPDLLVAICALGALLLHLRPGRAARAGAALVFFSGLFAKETLALLPVVLAAEDLALARDRRPAARWLRGYLPYAAALAAYAAVRLAVMPEMAPLRRHLELGPAGYAINVLPLFAEQLRYLLFPAPLSAFHVLHPVESLLSARGLAGLAVAGGFAGAAVWALRRDRTVLLALAIIAAPLLPVLYIPALGENTFAERYLYLPSVGLVLLAGLAVGRVVERRPAAWVPAVAVAAGLAAVFALGTVRRNAVWRDDFTLWSDTVEKSPDSAYARNELGVCLAERGELQRAVEQYRLAIQLKPSSSRAHGNLGVAYGALGRSDLALAELIEAVRLDPAYAKAFVNLGNTWSQVGRVDLALAPYREAVRLSPRSVEFRLSLANALSAAGDRAGAMAEYSAAVAQAPDSADAQMHIGVALGEAGRLEEAIGHLETAARLAPGDAMVRANLAHAYRLAGRPIRSGDR